MTPTQTLSGPVPRSTPSPIVTVETNTNGEFALLNLEPGPYRLTVGTNGYTRYDSPRLDIATNENKQDILIRLIPAGAISGRVQNTKGRPVAGLTVSLLKRSFNTNGQPAYSSVAEAKTNDLGEYRMYWVTPGRYYVTVAGALGANVGGFLPERFEFEEAIRSGDNEVVEGYLQTFFPGVGDASQASIVEVPEGMELRGIDFTVMRQHFHSIRGRVIDSTTGLPPPKASITISQRTITSGGSSSGGPRNYDPATGAFELPGVAPGQYGISALPNDGFFLGAPPVGTAWASTTVTVGESDVEDVVLTITVPLVITGRLNIEGSLPVTTSIDRLRVSLASATPSLTFFANLGAPVGADASFKLSAVAEGEFRVTMPGLPAGFYLKEARLNGVDVINKPAKFSAAGNLEVLISAKAGQVGGVLMDEQMRPTPSIEAVLIPNEGRDRPEFFKRATSNPAGQFTFTSVPPGDYKVFAWRSLEANAYFDPAVLAVFEQKGTPVRVAESSSETIQVRVISETSAP